MKRLTSAIVIFASVASFAAKIDAQSVYEPYYFATFAGLAGSLGSADGAAGARFNAPQGVALGNDGTVYVADTGNNIIRKISSTGVVSTLAGTAEVFGSTDGTGSAARFALPQGIAVYGGIVYVSDSANHTIRRISSDGVVTTFAGLAGNAGSVDGSGSAARFFYPIGLATDSSGDLFVADNGNLTIRKINPAGVVTTLAGSAGNAGSNDGTGAGAHFGFPTGLGCDGVGNVYVADTSNGIIRKITPAGVVTTIAGLPGATGSEDGMGSAARFNLPRGLAADASNIYVADTGNSLVRKISSTGVVTTLAGLAMESGNADGTGNNARFNFPFSLAISGTGDVFVADTNNHTIRVGGPIAGFLSLTISPGFSGLSRLLTGHAPPGATVEISAAANLAGAFGAIATVSADSSGQFQYQEAVGSMPKRFYRASIATGP